MSRAETAFLIVILAASCAPPKKASAPMPTPTAPSTELGVTATLPPGEPSPATLTAARLGPETCAEATPMDGVDAEVAAMRVAVDHNFELWHRMQPRCWDQMRGASTPPKHREKTELRERFDAALAEMQASLRLFGGDRGVLAEALVRRGDDEGTRAPSGTNNQVASVDEPDLVKTDDRYMYIAANGALRIFDARSPREVSVTRLSGGVRELFVEGDRAVVYSSSRRTRRACTYAYDCEVAGDGSSTEVSVLDISRRDHPVVTRKLALSGSFVAARRTGNVVHTVVADGDQGRQYKGLPPRFRLCGEMEPSIRAKFTRLKADNERVIRAHASRLPTMAENGGTPRPMCSGLLRTAAKDGDQFTSVVSFDLAKDGLPPSTTAVESRPGTVYASATSLYFAVPHSEATHGHAYPYYDSDETSDIHRFSIGTEPGNTRYAGSGRVAGHLLNQFAMDEWNGYLRVATTKGRVPDPATESEISILANTGTGDLTRVGALGKIAPGEDIRAVRFDDDRAYIVTFKKTDPLFVVDMSAPRAPRIFGELKIPGFSTYLHRIDPNHLLSIGFDASDHGSFAYFDGVLLQLFDVTHPTDPRLLWKEKIGSRGTSSEAATNHLAFNWFARDNILALPMLVCEGGSDGKSGQAAFRGLLVYDVDVAKGFARRGRIDHGQQGATCDSWWSDASSAVKRSVFVDDLVYSIAENRMKVQRTSRLGTDVADLSLDR